MKPDDMRFALVELGITQADLARLIDVTPRAISLWLGSERGIPGSVEAYIRLLLSLPAGQRQSELARLEKGQQTMKDGMYTIQFAGQSGFGVGMLVFDGGRVYGADAGKGKYDGHYAVNPSSRMVDVNIRVHMPAHQPSVLGITQPFDWMLDVSTTIDPSKDIGDVAVRSNLGRNLTARYEFVRPLPTE